MKRKAYRAIFQSGVSVINMGSGRGVKSSVDSEKDDAEIWLDEFGVWIKYKTKDGKDEEQYFDTSVFSSVMFDPGSQWIDEPVMCAAPPSSKKK